MLKFRAAGVPAMMASFKRKREQTPADFGRAMVAVLEETVPEVIAETPMLSGDLRRTIRVVGPEFIANTVRAYITAGDEDVDYALYVHEDPDAFHPVGDWKFIERPLMAVGKNFMPRVARKMETQIV